MRVLVQRVAWARVSVGGHAIAEIGPGLLLLVGITHTDTEEEARALAHKVAHLRIFENEQGKMHFSVRDVGGQVLVVSQFTLYADTSHGRRPDFLQAARPEHAQPLIERFVEFLREYDLPVQTGRFGAYMQVELCNDGPVTLLLEKEAPHSSS